MKKRKHNYIGIGVSPLKLSLSDKSFLNLARNFIAFDCGVHVKHVHVGDDGRVTIACLCDEKHFDRAFTPRVSANGDYVTDWSKLSEYVDRLIRYGGYTITFD